MACSGENTRAMASMSWLRCTTRIASGIASPFAWVGKPLPFQRSNVKRSASRTSGPEVQALDEHVGDLAAGREVVDRPLVGRLLDHPDDLVPLLRAASGGRERDDVAHHLGGVAGVVDERLGPDRDLVAEHGGDLVRVAGAADVPQQRHPVRRYRAAAGRSRRPRRSRSRAGTTAAGTRAAARRRCPVRAPASPRTRRGGGVASKMGSPPDVSAAPAGHDRLTLRNRAAAEPTSTGQGGHHGAIARLGRGPDPRGGHRRSDRPALVRRASPTPTSRGWSSATSTPRAGCSGGRSSCTSRTARPTTTSAAAAREAGRAGTSTSSSAASTAQRGRPSRAGRGAGQDPLRLPGAVRGSGVGPADLLHRPRACAAGRPADPLADARDRGEDASTSRPPTTSGRTSSTGGCGTAWRPTAGRSSARSTPLDHIDYRGDRRADRRERGRRGLQHHRAARGHAVLRGAGPSTARFIQPKPKVGCLSGRTG